MDDEGSCDGSAFQMVKDTVLLKLDLLWNSIWRTIYAKNFIVKN